jgi:hypothetical protein
MTRPRSSRRHAWHVQPVCESNSSHRQTIMVGHLFDAETERGVLGVGVGEGEECCISMEPIADARLSFCEDIRISRIRPNLTGVQLLCGHRFAAVNLLWYWSASPMICPMCRAEYSLPNSGQGGAPHATPVCSAVENFPFRFWRLLRSILTEQMRESVRALERENQVAVIDAVMTDMFENILNPSIGFYLLLSFSDTNGSPASHHSIRLQHNTANDPNIATSMRFSAPRSSMRYLSRILNVADMESRRSQIPVQMTATVLVGIGTTADGVAVMLPITNFENRNMPMIPGDTEAESPAGDGPVVVDATPPLLPCRIVVQVGSTDTRSEIQFEFFKECVSSTNTLVSIAVSLEGCPILTVATHHVVPGPHTG